MKVSVCVQTYNHSNYIKECLDSILAQKVDFDLEVLLGEDDSTDDTRAICKEYALKYPNIIKLFLHDRKNVIYINNRATGRYNFMYNLKYANGKYLAFCEGDDYWTDPYKLQKQVDFLEAEASFSLCFHPVKIQTEPEKKIVEDQITRQVAQENTVKELSYGNFIHTPSVMIRNNFELPTWFEKVPFGDLSLWTLTALKGKIFKMEEEMAIYRVHSESLMGNLKRLSFSQKMSYNEVLEFMYIKLYEITKENGFLKQAADLVNRNRVMAVVSGDKAKSVQFSKTILKQYRTFFSVKVIFFCIAQLFYPLLNRSNYSKFN